MSNNWIGYMVSVKCKDDLGTYQGQISAATGTTMTLIKAFRNGVPHREPEVILNATDIEDLKLIDSQPNSTNGQSTVTVAKPVAKRAGRSVSMSECTPATTAVINNNNNGGNKLQQQQQNHSKSKVIEIETRVFTGSGGGGGGGGGGEYALYKNGTPTKRDKFKMKWKDEACFGTSVDPTMMPEFDFEKNLALFDKEAVWEEINASQRPDVVNQADGCRGGGGGGPPKYRHDENVIATLPTAFRQIVVPAPDVREYVTDDGLVVPSVTQELRRQLFAAAERRGLGVERQAELAGRAAAEMALQLLGGGHRLNPHNTHQWPTVVALCGPHRPGAAAANAARQLASHGVHTVLHAPQPDAAPLRAELALYKLTKNRVAASVAALPPTADLILVALCDGDDVDVAGYPLLAAWANTNRAPVLALDPPAAGTPGIHTKFSLLPALPLSHAPDNGKLYLCNLGFPLKIFKDVGIKYRSPFGPKFVIPLHPNDTSPIHKLS